MGFDADSAEITPTAADVLNDLADDIRTRSTSGPIIVNAWTADPPGATAEGCQELSQRRADAIARGLTDLGINVPITARGAGIAPGQSSNSTGHYDPVRADAMRFAQITY